MAGRAADVNGNRRTGAKCCGNGKIRTGPAAGTAQAPGPGPSAAAAIRRRRTRTKPPAAQLDGRDMPPLPPAATALMQALLEALANETGSSPLPDRPATPSPEDLT